MADNLPFQVSWSHDAKNAVRQVLGEARTPAAQDDLIQAIRTLEDQLQHNPRAVGDVYRVVGVIEKRWVVTESLRVDFAVDMQRHVVMVRSCQALWRGNGWVPH
jgi:hypothetical protein